MAKVSRPLPQPLSLHWSRRCPRSEYLPEKSHSGAARAGVVHGRANSSEGARVHAMLEGLKVRNWSDPCGRRALTAWRRLRDCTLVFVQRGRISFHQKAPPPVERVESIMTSLAGSLGRNATAQQHVQITSHASSLVLYNFPAFFFLLFFFVFFFCFFFHLTFYTADMLLC